MNAPVDPTFADFETYDDDPYETYAGPFYYRTDADGVLCAFKVAPQHLNGGGAIHGGLLMTFADFALFAIGKEALGERYGVTISFNAEFTATAAVGDIVECRGEVVENTRSLVFVRAKIFSGGRDLLNFSGIIKKTGPRT